jgi:ribosomal protein S18 acetylase RimI-like enzyme
MHRIRQATPQDEDILWHMLYEAAHMMDAGESLDDARNNPDLARYVTGWGRSDDLGFIAFHLLNANSKGYGYVDDAISELAMGVVPPWRGRGVGTALLRCMIGRAKENHSGISLSVRSDNPAVRLYERSGFTAVPGSETTNRVGRLSYTMVLRF